jgi:hypothetical protein
VSPAIQFAGDTSFKNRSFELRRVMDRRLLNLTTLKLLDELFPPYFAGQVAPKGYFWKVVYDPTRIGEDPGYFMAATSG